MTVAASLALREAGGQFAAVVRERQGPTPEPLLSFHCVWHAPIWRITSVCGEAIEQACTARTL
jgi:hypothetical protein